MSGGSFNYLYLRVQDVQMNTLYSLLYDTREMVSRLQQEGKTEAAEEILAYYMNLTFCIEALEKRGNRISNLMKAVEWWCSCDSGPEVVDLAMEELNKLEGYE